ncbi:MAG: DUF2155 domain-containing protein [Marinibacterium sp.]
MPGAAQERATPGTGAVLRALDKVDGKTRDVEVANGGRAKVFGLIVEMAECRFPAENPTGDAFAYLVVREAGSEAVVFAGWMIASSPALNALDHPRYDVWLLRCTSA